MYAKSSNVTTEIFTLDELKRYLVWTTSDVTRDADMQQCIRSATEAIEGILGISLRAHKWTYSMESWGDVELLYGPLANGAVAVNYYDENNVDQVLSSSEYLVIHAMSRILFNGIRPTLYSTRPDNIRITYTSDPEILTDIDQKKTWIRLIAGELFENPINDKDEIRKIALRMIAPIRTYI